MCNIIIYILSNFYICIKINIKIRVIISFCVLIPHYFVFAQAQKTSHYGRIPFDRAITF